MTPLSAFHSRLLPLVPGCPQPLLDQALIDSAVDFCERSLGVMSEVYPTTTRVGQSEYDLDLDRGVCLVQAISVTVNGSPVGLVTRDARVISTNTSVLGAPTSASVSPSGDLVLYPAPDGTYAIEVVAATKPTRSATAVADELFERWVDVIVFGAAQRICEIPGQPFSSPANADLYARKARVGANSARVDASYGRVRSSSRVAPRAFA